MFDNRVTINGAIYYEDWTGIQQLVTETCGATFTSKCRHRHVYGGELEASVALTSELTVTTAAGYTHANIVAAVQARVCRWPARAGCAVTGPRPTSIVYRHPISDDYAVVLRGTNE